MSPWEQLQQLFGRYPELLIAVDDAKKAMTAAMTLGDQQEKRETEFEFERAVNEVHNCKYDAALAFMFGLRCAIQMFPADFGTIVNESLPTPDAGSLWDQIGV